MERLTKRDKYGHWYTNERINDRMMDDEPYPHAYDGKPIDKLADYEDLEEQCIEENQCGLRELLMKWKAFFDDIAELYDYRKTEEQGLLLRTDVTAGSTVYALWSVPTERKYVIYPADVKEINIKEYGRTGRIEYVLEPIYYRGRHQKFYSDDFGKTVFLTEAEAESALAEKGGAE